LDNSTTIKTNYNFIAFIALVFLLPSRDDWYRWYTLALVVGPLIFLLVGYKSRFNSLAKWVVGWLFFFILSNVIKLIFLPAPFNMAKEYTEFFRILILLPVLLIKDKYFTKKNFAAIIKFIFFYLIIDSFITFTEIGIIKINSPILINIKKIYHSENQLGLGYLAKGLSSHGAEHGIIMNFILILLLICIKYFKNKSTIYYISIVLCLFNLVACGSKTSMLGFAFIFAVFIFMLVLKENLKIPFSYLLIILLLIFGIIWALNSGKFIRLKLLLSVGTSGTSYVSRLSNWGYFFNIMERYLYLFPFGWGKSIFIIDNNKTFYTDNEYFTILIIHGIVVLLCILTIMWKYITRCFIYWNRINIYHKFLFFLLLDYLFIGYASVSFSSPTILALLCIVYKFAIAKDAEENILVKKYS